jgi:hypothetical protein
MLSVLLLQARPMWAGRPYQPAPSDHPLTQPEDPGLETEARAAERATFDAAMQEKLQKAEVRGWGVGGTHWVATAWHRPSAQYLPACPAYQLVPPAA